MRTLLLLGSVLGLATAVGCSNELRDDATAPSPDAGTPTECDEASPCSDGSTCVDGACVASVACSDGAPCEAGLVCTDGVCLLPVDTGACEASETCRASSVCVDGTCETRTCEADDDCPDDALCVGTICRWAPPCGEDACDEIGDGTCRSERCVPGCVTNADCGGTRSTGCIDGTCVDYCTGNADCEPGAPCVDGFCQDPACRTSDDCAQGERCSRGACIPDDGCASNDDCGEGSICEDGVCVGGGECVRDDDCGPNRFCDARRCVDSAPCSTTADCPSETVCSAGLCVPRVCRGNPDCREGTVCEDGRCIEAPDAEVVSVFLLTPAQSLGPADAVPLRAIALDGDQRAIPGLAFTFEADDPEVLRIDESTARSGGSPGSTFVRARVAGTTAPVSAPVLFTNLGQGPDSGRRVSVINRNTGVPVGNASVRWGDATRTTDAQGRASFDDATTRTLEVDAEGFDLLTLVEPDGDDLLVALRPTFRTREAAGFQGEMDFSATASRGDARLGIAGAAIEGDLIDLSVADLIGTTFLTPVGAGPLGSQDLPLPAGLVLAIDSFGVGDIKATYYAQSSAGLSFAWALGGRAASRSLTGLLTGGGGISALLRNLLPLFETFDHTVGTFVGEPRDLVPDREDVDGDGDREELIPDYESFPELTLRPSTELRYRTRIGFPILPSFDGRPAEVVLVVGGMMVDGVGFIPTGLTASGPATSGLTPDPVTLRMAPPSGGLSAGTFAVILLTFEPPSGGGGGIPGGGGGGFDVEGTLSGRLFLGARLPETIDFAGELFPALPSGVRWDSDQGELTLSPSDLDVIRISVEGAERSWEVVAPGSTELRLDARAEFADAEDVAVDGIQLRSGVTWGSLLAPSSPTLRSLAEASSGFVRGSAE